MKAYNEAQTTIIEAAATAIQAAALEAVTAIVAAKGTLTLVIRTQVAALEKAKVGQKDIADLVRDNVQGAATPAHISKTLCALGIRLRDKKRSDAGFLRMADDALTLCLEAKPIKDAKPPTDPPTDPDLDGDGDEGGDQGGGHTAATLAALLGSLDPDLVAEALEIAGLA